MSVTRFTYHNQIKPVNYGWGFWWQWVLLHLLGYLTSLLFIEIGMKPDVDVVSAMMGGAIMGICQWLVLKSHISQTRWWIIINCLTWGLIAASSMGAIGWTVPSIRYIFPRIINGLINGAIIGTFLGLGQWLVLGPQIPRAQWWIFAHAVSWGVGLAMGWSVGLILWQVTQLFIGEVIGLGITWLIVSAITGLTLMRLLWR